MDEPFRLPTVPHRLKLWRTVASIPAIVLITLDTLNIFEDEHIESTPFRLFIKISSVSLALFHMFSTCIGNVHSKGYLDFEFTVHTIDLLVHALIIIYSLCMFIIPYVERGVSMEAHFVILGIHVFETLGIIPLYNFFLKNEIIHYQSNKRVAKVSYKPVFLPKDIRFEETKQLL